MTTENWYRPAKVVLLTGAGFSNPYGGFLASEMWSLVLNQPQIRASEKLHDYLLEDLNYESVYDAVQTSGQFTEKEKTDFITALENAYGQLDGAIRNDEYNRRGVASRMCQCFIGRFAGSGQERGFVFTLNQDLLVERFYSQNAGQLQIPALGHPKWFNAQFRSALEKEDRVMLPSDDDVQKYSKNFWMKGSGFQDFVYVKLHGSYGWQFRDGTNALVVGRTKSGRIAGEPLLLWYYNLFNAVLRAGNTVLVVVGYGFMDEHINEVIADSINTAGLRLHIISPKPPAEFKHLLAPVEGFIRETAPRGQEIWQGVYGYTCASLDELVQNDLTPKGKDVFTQIGL